MALALTQCWFTRSHMAASPGRRGSDGVFRSNCRYCERPIISWDRDSWHLADGFNLLEIQAATQAAFLYVLDTRDDEVVARFPIDHLETEEEITALAKQIEEEHGTAEPGSTLVLRDSRNSLGGRKVKRRPAPPTAVESEAPPEPVAETPPEPELEPEPEPELEPEPEPAAPARTDRVTGLPNRAAFEAVFSEACAHSASTGTPLSLALCDVDGLDLVNRAEGHDAGDALLRSVAAALGALDGCSVYVSRNRGFEFAVLFDGAPASAQAALQNVHARISCGIAEVPADNPRSALQAADRALQRAKSLGGGHVVTS